ncbi:MAG TPA: rhodanese-like domain-containing protein [Methylovirgula sp.]
MRIIFLLAAALFLGAAAPAPVPEPSGLWQGAMHGDTPDTLKGATVLTSGAFAKLNKSKHPLLLDVAETPKKPPAMGEGMPWLPTHRTIPDAIWLVGAGDGTSDPAFAAALKLRVADLTQKDLTHPIVVFCHPHCWGSWNTAKRLIEIGYTHVYWYPEGVEGWQNDGHDTIVAKPDATWKAISEAKPITQGLNKQ